MTKKTFKGFSELNSDEQAEAIKRGKFIGYNINEIRHLLFWVQNGKMVIRDETLLANVFPKV